MAMHLGRQLTPGPALCAIVKPIAIKRAYQEVVGSHYTSSWLAMLSERRNINNVVCDSKRVKYC